MGKRQKHNNRAALQDELTSKQRDYLRSCQMVASSRYEYSLPSNVDVRKNGMIEEGLALSYLTQIGYLDNNKEVQLGDSKGRPDIFVPSINKGIEVVTRGYATNTEHFGPINKFDVRPYSVGKNTEESAFYATSLSNKQIKLDKNNYGRGKVDLVIVSNLGGDKDQLEFLKTRHEYLKWCQGRTFNNLFLYLTEGKSEAGLYHINDNLKRYDVDQCPLDVSGYELICRYLRDKDKDNAYEYPDFTGEQQYYNNITKEEKTLRDAMQIAEQQLSL